MSVKTTNYQLTKPEENDYYDVNVPNGNMDIIDEKLKESADKTATAVQAITLGGAAVPKSGATVQLPAYPTSLPANGGNATNANYANAAGSAPANGGTANYAHYSSHAVSSGGAALRNNTATVGGSPSGGSDGDGWDICS